MSMNPPAPAPTKKAAALATVKREASRHRDVLLFLAGMVAQFLLGSRY